MPRFLSAALLFALPLAVAANNLVLGYIVDTTLETDDGLNQVDIDGDGFSIAFDADLGSSVYAYGEYTDRSFDEGGFELDISQTRLGLGLFQGIEGNDGRFYFGAGLERAEISAFGSSGSESGFGARAGVLLVGASRAEFQSEIIYLSIDDTEGFEFLARLAMPFGETVSGFVDYRRVDVEDDSGGSDDELTIDDIRVGVKLGF